MLELTLTIARFALLAALAVWIVLSLAHGIARTEPKILDDTHAFLREPVMA
jgi:hypothetical protein